MSEVHYRDRSLSIAPATAIHRNDFEDVFKTIYQNRYFTNHGPLAKEFEALVEDFLAMDNVVTVGNESLAMLIAMAGLNIKGKMIMPAFDSAIPSQIARWLGIQPVFCDVERQSHQVSIEQLKSVLSDQVEAVVLVETWGNRCDREVLDFLCARNLKVIVTAFDSFASQTSNRYVDERPNIVTTFSFGPGKMLTTLQGGAIACNDDDLADKFRNIRSSYGVRRKSRVTATCNGRFSEFQAGVGIKQFSLLENTRAHHNRLADAYGSVLNGCDDIEIFEHRFTDNSNGQCYPIRITDRFPMSRNSVVEALGLPGKTGGHWHAKGEFPVAKQLCSQILQLPTGPTMRCETAIQIAKRLVQSGVRL